MTELKVLQDLGFSETESLVYVSGLRSGPDTVINIAKKAGIKRTTCYAVLNNLVSKGYISQVKKETTTLYVSEPPSLLLKSFQEKEKQFEDLLGYFEAQARKHIQPRIRYFEGKQSLGQVYTNVLFPPPTQELYIYGGDVAKVYETFKDFPGFYDKTMEL